MLIKVIKAVIAAIGSAIAIRLSAKLIQLGTQEGYALIVAVITSLFVALSLDFLLTVFPMRFRNMRRRFSTMFSIEGYWYETVSSPDHPLSYACIEYDYESKTFSYHGTNFTTEFNQHATFISDIVDVRKNEKQISIKFEATVMHPDRENISGYATINFVADGKVGFTRGNGYFVEKAQLTEADPSKVAHSGDFRVMKEYGLNLERIPDNFVKRTLKSRYIYNDRDILKLMTEYKKHVDDQITV